MAGQVASGRQDGSPSVRPELRKFSRANVFGAALEFMDGLGYITTIEFAEPLARLSRRSGAKPDRRGSLER